MKTDRKATDLQWIVTEVNGRIASVSLDYRLFAGVAEKIAALPPRTVDAVSCRKISTAELFALSEKVKWEDLQPFGSPYQLFVWKKLFEITHHGEAVARLMSYGEFAAHIGKEKAVRQVAHAVAMNPVCFIIPCHLIIPKESIERLRLIQSESGLFKWKALYIVDAKVDYGEYVCGREVKRLLIRKQLNLREE